MPTENVQAESVEITETVTEPETVVETVTQEVVPEETVVVVTQNTESIEKTLPENEDTTVKEELNDPVTTEPEVVEEDVVDVDALLVTIKDKDKQVSTVTSKFKQEQKKVETLQGQVSSLEAVVSGLIETKMTAIPEEFHALVPEGNMVAKLDWINKAEASGLFSAKKNPNVEIGKPLNLGNKNEKATSNSSAQQKLSNYFSNFYNK